MTDKLVFRFGAGKADGKGTMKNELGGKGASLAEATNLGLPVPPGFTIATEVCNLFLETGGIPDEVKEQVKKSLAWVEKIMDTKFGDPENPLLVSTRSGARKSMPGMMETVLNVGLTTKTIPGLIKKSNKSGSAPVRAIPMHVDQRGQLAIDALFIAQIKFQ